MLEWYYQTCVGRNVVVTVATLTVRWCVLWGCGGHDSSGAGGVMVLDVACLE